MRKSNNTAAKKEFCKGTGYLKRQHQMPDPKILATKVKYALSLNPAAQPFELLTQNESFKGDLKVYTNEILRVIKLYKYSNIRMYPEISSAGRWHYHGWIEFKDIAKFMLFELPILKQYFSFEIDTIADDETWNTYVMKCSHFMEEYTKSEGIPYEITQDTKPLKVDALQKDYKYEWIDDYDEDGEFVGQHRVKAGHEE